MKRVYAWFGIGVLFFLLAPYLFFELPLLIQIKNGNVQNLKSESHPIPDEIRHVVVENLSFSIRVDSNQAGTWSFSDSVTCQQKQDTLFFYEVSGNGWGNLALELPHLETVRAQTDGDKSGSITFYTYDPGKHYAFHALGIPLTIQRFVECAGTAIDRGAGSACEKEAFMDATARITVENARNEDGKWEAPIRGLEVVLQNSNFSLSRLPGLRSLTADVDSLSDLKLSIHQIPVLKRR